MRLLVVATAVLLSACANAIESRTAQGGGVGLAYMAPMRLLTVTATRAPAIEPQAITNARNALVGAENELTAARAALTTATTEARNARALANAAVPAVPALETLAVSKEAVQRVAQARFDTANAAAVTARGAYQSVVTASRDARALENARNELVAAETDLTAARAVRDGASGDDRVAAQRRVDIATARAERARAAQEQLVMALGPPRETVEVSMGAAIGDRNTRFVANVSNNWFRSARGRIVVGQNGLLQSANLTVDGQVDEVLVGVAQSLVALSTTGGSGRQLWELKGIDPAYGCDSTGALVEENATTIPQSASPAPTTLSISFNPVVPADIARVNQALCGAGFSYRISVRADAPSARAITESPPAENPTQPLTTNFASMCSLTVGRAPNQRRRCPGLVYRQNEPMNIDIIRFDNELRRQTYTERSFSFSVPNSAPVDVLRYDDAMFVTRRDDVGFVDGSFVSLDFDRPSEAAVAAGIPFRIVRGTTEALSELVQLRVNLENQQAALIQAEQAAAAARANDEANAEIAQLESTRRLLELRLAVEEARQRLREAEAEAAVAQ